MNRRYRRQVRLRSRAHRRGELLDCGCHPIRVSLPIRWTTAFGECEPAWSLPRRVKRIHSLPDLAQFDAGLTSYREALAKLGPVVEQVGAALQQMREVYDAGSRGPESGPGSSGGDDPPVV